MRMKDLMDQIKKIQEQYDRCPTQEEKDRLQEQTQPLVDELIDLYNEYFEHKVKGPTYTNSGGKF